MIRVNRQTDYAVRLVLALARRPAGAQVPTSQIREEMLIPPALAQRIVADLARGGFILTQPGRIGGIQLARPANEITLYEIVDFYEGPIHISDCLTTDFDCPFETKCPVRRRWNRVDLIIRDALNKITFEELASDAELADIEGLTELVAH